MGLRPPCMMDLTCSGSGPAVFLTIVLSFWMVIGGYQQFLLLTLFYFLSSYIDQSYAYWHLLSLVMSHTQSGSCHILHTWGTFISLRQLSLTLLCTTVGWLHSLILRGQSYFPIAKVSADCMYFLRVAYWLVIDSHVYPFWKIAWYGQGLIWSEVADWDQTETKWVKQAWRWAGWCVCLRRRKL